MSAGRYVICCTCRDGTRHAYWQGICPTTGRAAWTRDRAAAVAFAEFRHALAFARACFDVGTGRLEQYDVVDLGDLLNSCAVSAAGA